MACFFRRSIASQLSKICGRPEEVFIPYLSAVPVSKKQLGADFRLSVNALVQNGTLSRDGDLQTVTETLARQFQQDSVLEEATPGRNVLNFRVNKLLLAERLLGELHTEPDLFGLRSDLFCDLQRGRTLVEFSSPNIAKKFHAGHLRSTIIGNFIANLKEALGNEVIRMNYLGDWGMQFGLLGTGFQWLGSLERLAQNPLQHLFEVYVQVNKEAEKDDSVRLAARDFFKRLEEHDEQALSLWKQFRDITIEEYKRIYKRLGVTFDLYSGESCHESSAHSVLKELKSLGLLQQTEKGLGVVDLSPDGDMSTYTIIQRSNGTSLYITRDLAAALDRRKQYNFDEMIYVTDKSQCIHFQQLFQIVQAMGHQWAQRCRHVPFGLVQGMSTRLGEVVFLEDVLDEARTRMLDNMNKSRTTKELCDPEATAECVGISALIVQDFKGSLISDYKFEWDRVLQAQGDTGVFLQYTHARLCSLLRMNPSSDDSCVDLSPLLENRSIAILQHLLRYDEVIHQSAKDLQPKHLVNYLMTLCHLLASAHRELSVKGSTDTVAKARLRLFRGSRSLLANGMALLGIRAVERM